MTNKAGVFIIILFIHLTNVAFTLITDDWELAKEKKGVTIYTRSIEGQKIKEFKAFITIDADIEKIVEIINDDDNIKDWQKNTKGGQLLKEINNNEMYSYVEIGMPWPMSDRDIVFHRTISKKEDGSILIHLDSAPQYYDDQDGYVRMNTVSGDWELTPTSDNKIEIRYQFFGDPEVKLPNWILNMFIVDGPYESLLALKELAEA